MRSPASCRHLILASCILLLLHLLPPATAVHRTLEEARAARQQLVAKHLKHRQKANGALKLVGGVGPHEGNVEILHQGRWGAVCDDEWDDREAEVVCKQLGFAGWERTTHSGAFGPAKRKYWMDNVICGGAEAELALCRFDGWASNDCDPTEAAGVVCRRNETQAVKAELAKPVTMEAKEPAKRPMPRSRMWGTTRAEFRLSGGRQPTEGRVEVRLGDDATWGAVCADGWSLLEANVLCQALGLGYAQEALQTDFFNERPSEERAASRPNIVLSGTECFGNETTLHRCRHHTRVFCPGRQRRTHVAAVMCVEPMADLVVQHRELEESAHLEDRPLYWLQCAMEENCLASQAYEVQRDNVNWRHETRRLLKFTASVLNAGTADFRPSIPKHLWEWHMCHMHYHSMEVFAVFNVFDDHGRKVAEGHKASFCLEDNQCKPGVERKYACANYGDQGISVDCYDIYKYNIDCQWVDITDLEPGLYTLQISVNPEFKVPEQSYDNNSARCRLLYTETYARVYDCRLERHF